MQAAAFLEENYILYDLILSLQNDGTNSICRQALTVNKTSYVLHYSHQRYPKP